MSSTDENGKSKPYRTPTPLIIKSNSPITITDGKFTIVHSGSVVFHGGYVEFELEDTQKTLITRNPSSQANLSSSFTIPPQLPEGYRLFMTTDAKVVAHDRKRSRYETYKRDRDISYITVIRRNGSTSPLIQLGSLLNPESMISVALREFSKTSTFLRSELKAQNLPVALGQGQRLKACLDVLEKEGFLTKELVKVGAKRTIDKYIRTDKKLE